MKKKIFITTTLPYPNADKPHVGFLFEAVLSDSINRYFKNNGYQTYFNTGVDEEGLKIYQKATSLGLSPQEYLDSVIPNYIKFMDIFNIKYDNFYRTSSDEHSRKVQDVWLKLISNGDIYKKNYIGNYCVGCESFKQDKELKENRCVDHPNTELNKIEEDNYFFNLSKYIECLFKWIEQNPLLPENKYTELKNFINEYDEISVSRLRKNCPWGTIVPNDEEHTVYIWLSALLNYIFAANNWVGWDNCYSIQLCGPDNLRFQAQIFQSFLSALGYKNTDKILVHGTILDSYGKKMSKTEGNVIDPFEQLEKYGINAVRYYTLAGLNTTENSNWDEDVLVQLYNSHVCNDWGNLISRVLHLIDTKTDSSKITGENVTEHFNSLFSIYKLQDEISESWERLAIKEALEKTNQLVKIGKKYINDEKPWALEDCSEILNNLYYLIKSVGSIYKSVFPIVDIDTVISNKKKVILFEKIK